MSVADRVKKLAAAKNVLARDGDLKPLDSMGIIELVVALESEFSVSIPTEGLRPERFASLQTLSKMLEELTEGVRR
jgi:acyl carrier protein